MNIRQCEVEGVIEAEGVGTPFIVNDSRVVSRGPAVWIHNHAFVFPGASGVRAHCISNALGAAMRRVGHVISAIPLVEPRTFLIILGFGIDLHNVDNSWVWNRPSQCRLNTKSCLDSASRTTDSGCPSKDMPGRRRRRKPSDRCSLWLCR